jgi:hypothetical protein
MGKTVKRFAQEAKVQEQILLAFEEAGWPPRIDDPLPPNGKSSPQDRRRAAISHLNRGQLNRLIIYSSDGGEGICWAPISDRERRAKRS